MSLVSPPLRRPASSPPDESVSALSARLTNHFTGELVMPLVNLSYMSPTAQAEYLGRLLASAYLYGVSEGLDQAQRVMSAESTNPT